MLGSVVSEPFYLQYNFPPYSVGGDGFWSSRREKMVIGSTCLEL